ncbi:MAG: hypothetical protein MUC91_06675 [Verrucomicrobia bacterium]|jgi:hypothetical protein|nr:hypothetical protein [Verrucomicrobiota bacterium]
MSSEAYTQILLASLAGGCVGALVLWNRSRSLVQGKNRLREAAVLVVGTFATVCALLAFNQAFRDHPQVNAAVVLMLVAGWVSVLHSVVPLPLPRSMLRVRMGEFAFLRARWSGVRTFGALLRNTPLRRLGGQVFLAGANRDATAVLRGLHSAEVVHIWAFLLCCPWFVLWGVRGQWACLVSGFAVNVLINVYPVLHLRYVTWRIEQFAARMRRSRSA